MIKTQADPLYARLAIRAKKTIPDLPKYITLSGASALDKTLLPYAVYQVVAYKDGVDTVRGTGFALDGYGIVTNQHVIDGITADYWQLVNAADSNVVLKVKSWKSPKKSKISASPTLDLAILNTDIPPNVSLSPHDSIPDSSSDVLLAGFPAAHLVGLKMAITSGNITSTKIVTGTLFALTSINIIGGNSGGPLLNDKGKVVAVGTYGHTNSAAPNSAIAITEIEKISAMPAVDIPF